MIVLFEDLVKLEKPITMVDGSFDPLHDGHIAYFRGAAELGLPVMCNVAPDKWTVSKHSVLLSQSQRGIVLDAIRYISYVHLALISTLDVLDLLRPRIYVKGNDWLARGGVPEDEQRLCQKLEIEIKYLDTVLNSSSQILAKWSDSQTTG